MDTANNRRCARLASRYELPGGFKRIYHYHIRKTAGTSLNHMFFTIDSTDSGHIYRELIQSNGHRFIGSNHVFVGWNKKLIDLNVSELKDKDKFICSYIGTFGMAHNLEIVLQAAELLKNIKEVYFLLIGDGAEKSKIIDKCRQKDLANVDILPLQPKDKILKFYKLSDVGLIMLKDSYLFKSVVPSKMFEYMAAKTPVIMSMPEGEATRIVRKYNCGLLCCPDSPDRLAESIMHLFNNRDKMEQLGNNGYKAITEKYNRGAFASKYQELIEAI